MKSISITRSMEKYMLQINFCVIFPEFIILAHLPNIAWGVNYTHI